MYDSWEIPTPLVDPHADQAIREALTAVGSAGSFFTGEERLAFAEYARSARGLTSAAANLSPIVAEAIARIAAEASTSRSEHVGAWEKDRRDVLAYVELVAVVSVICSIDSYRVGVGAPLDILPEPVPGDPVPVIDERAKKTNSWVPTVGPALAPSALSALPDENGMKKALGIAFYLPDEVVHQYDVEPGRELSRPQLELVAARTSWLNQCFF